MPAQTQDKNYWAFIKGYITEASPLTFPEGASLDEENFVLDKDGSRQRRKGLIREPEADLTAISTVQIPAASKSKSFIWEEAGDAKATILVIKDGPKLRFYLINGTNVVDDGSLLLTANLSDYAANGATDEQIANSPMDFSTLQGRLIVVGRHTEPLRCDYTGAIVIENILIEVRDLAGQDDGLEDDERPIFNPADPGLHYYNLLNQGWKPEEISKFEEDQGVLPSNADVADRGYAIDSGGKRTFQPKEVTTYTATSPAPKGHFKYNIFNEDPGVVRAGFVIDRFEFVGDGPNAGEKIYRLFLKADIGEGFSEEVSFRDTNIAALTGVNQCEYIGSPRDQTVTFVLDGGVTRFDVTMFPEDNPGIATAGAVCVDESTNPDTRSSGTVLIPFQADFKVITTRFDVTTTFAGRIWYAGIDDEELSERVYYTQLPFNERWYGRCYQNNDPTDPEAPDLLDTDGGFIDLPGCGRVTAMEEFGKNLVVFATRGVWIIGPGDKGFFSGTSYTVDKADRFGLLARESIINAGEALMYFGVNGITVLAPEQVSSTLVARSISQNTIQKFYLGLTELQRQNAVGVIDYAERVAYWYYPSDALNAPNVRDKVLGIDLNIEAFFKWTLDKTQNLPFYPIVLPVLTDVKRTVKVLFRTLPNPESGNSFLFASEYAGEDWKDWGSVDAPAFLSTGYELMEEGRKRKSMNYVHIFMKRVQGSSCKVKAQWDWSLSGNTGKFSSTQEAYRDRENYDVSVAKLRVRGTGPAVNMRFDTSPDKECHLLGWTVFAQSETLP